MTRPTAFSLFNAADEVLANLIGLETFEESLLLNVLFQPRVLFHESVLYNSTLLARHLAKAAERESLFEHAARRGIIAPAFRNQGCLHLSDAYDAMLTPDVYGPTYPLLHPEMKPFRHRVEAAIDSGVAKRDAFYLPRDQFLSVGYLATLRQMLQLDAPPDAIDFHADRKFNLEILWEDTKK